MGLKGWLLIFFINSYKVNGLGTYPFRWRPLSVIAFILYGLSSLLKVGVTVFEIAVILNNVFDCRLVEILLIIHFVFLFDCIN